MAIEKKITLNNGVTTNYHRIVSIHNIINVAYIIEIASYTSEEKRQEEKTKTKTGEEMNVYINTERLVIPYDKIEETIDIEGAYKYLKTIDKYSDSKDKK